MFILLLNLKGFNHNVAHPYDGTVKTSCDQNLSFVHDLHINYGLSNFYHCIHV